MTASRVDVLYATLLQALGSKGVDQDLAQVLDDALREWERQKYASHKHAELAVGVAHLLFGNDAPREVIEESANILMSIGGSGLAAITQAVHKYNSRVSNDKGKKVADAIARKPAVLMAVMKELRERDLKVAGAWEWGSAGILFRHDALSAKLAAHISRNEDAWLWTVGVKIGSHSGPNGVGRSAKAAADAVDEKLLELGYILLGEPLRDPEDF